MSKKYRLLKDLPQCKAGTIFEKYADNAVDYEALGIKQWNGGSCRHESVFLLDCHVEDNPDWFELISEKESKDVFTWDEIEKALSEFDGHISDYDLIKHDLQRYLKQSKQPPTPQKKERVLDIKYLQEDNNAVHHYSFTSTKWISKELIKEAIESVLNNDGFRITVSPNLFTQEAIDKAREDAFNAAREVFWDKHNGRIEYDNGDWSYSNLPKYMSASDYINSLNTKPHE